MRLRKFEVRNFKALQHVSVDFEDLLVLIGENNCGKSCVLLALDWFLSGSSIKDSALFHKFQIGSDDAIELIGHFDMLSDKDKAEVAVRGRTNGDEWVLKKKFWFEKANAGEGEKGVWKEQLFSYSAGEAFASWPDPANSWRSFPSEYQPLIQQIPSLPAKPNNDSREVLKQLVREQLPNLVQPTPADWVPNPGGGGNWKSNANSIIPRSIYVRAVHDASDETNAKDASTYGKLINLIVERQLAGRPEIQQLRAALDQVMQLFRPDEAHPEHQAEEIRVLQGRITESLENVIGAQALIKTQPIELRNLLLPSTSLVIRDRRIGIDTDVSHQGHGLQRTLIMTLLQLLTEAEYGTGNDDGDLRPAVFIIEEPELYMHPQMERRMRDLLYDLAMRERMQVVACTHSPVFLDIAEKYESIVRLTRDANGRVVSHQVTGDLFPGAENQSEKERLQTVSRFDPAVNEVFFSSQVVLFEEFSTIAAFERTAELTGIFARHPRLRREVTMVDCAGKQNIPAFQRTLNAFHIPYRVVHDEDRSKQNELATNARIAAMAGVAIPSASTHMLSPEDLEGVLGLVVPKSASKPYLAVKKVEEIFGTKTMPQALIEAVNFAYFAQITEPGLAAA
jgi:putative ATP-dependent endonuclease of OLD family